MRVVFFEKKWNFSKSQKTGTFAEKCVLIDDVSKKKVFSTLIVKFFAKTSETLKTKNLNKLGKRLK